MTCSGSIYFLGRYRPAYFEASSLEMLRTIMLDAVQDMSNAPWYMTRIADAADALKNANGYTAWQSDHCDKGVSMAKRPHDPWLDETVKTLPDCPNLHYSLAI